MKFCVSTSFDMSMARTLSKSFCKSRIIGSMNASNVSPLQFFLPTIARNTCQCTKLFILYSPGLAKTKKYQGDDQDSSIIPIYFTKFIGYIECLYTRNRSSTYEGTLHENAYGKALRNTNNFSIEFILAGSHLQACKAYCLVTLFKHLLELKKGK